LGRTIPSYRRALEDEIAKWGPFRSALRGKELEAFDRMMNACRAYASAGGMATRPVVTEGMFMCILLGMQKEILEIKERLERLERQLQGA